MSTDAHAQAVAAGDLEARWSTAPGVAFRREAFGALAYRYADRRLLFVHSAAAAALVERLEASRPLRAVLEAWRREPDHDPDVERAAVAALGPLRALGLLRADGEAAAPPGRAPLGDARRGKARSHDTFRRGLAAPICLTWELTYGCNLRCAHCLSSSGEARPEELTTAEAKALVDAFAAMRVFYVNVGGGEPMSRPDFVELMDHCVERGVGVKFSTNGTLLDDAAADWIAARADMLDVQISVDGATPETSDPLRGRGAFLRARRGMERLAARGFRFKINATATRANVHELDALHAMARELGADLRLTRLRPSGRGREVWDAMRPTHAQNRVLYDWLHAHPDVLTGDSFFHLSAYGKPLEGLNLCGAGRIVCCVDPVGDVYACPFVLDAAFAAGNVRDAGGFPRIWAESPRFSHLREWQVGGTCRDCNAYAACHGGCMAVKHLTGRSLDAPDPDCVFGRDEAPPGRRVALPVAAASP